LLTLSMLMNDFSWPLRLMTMGSVHNLDQDSAGELPSNSYCVSMDIVDDVDGSIKAGKPIIGLSFLLAQSGSTEYSISST
jgi:hypothetical protein